MTEDTQTPEDAAPPLVDAIFFSASKKAFYHGILKERYGANWPADAVEIDAATHATFTGKAPEGSELGADAQGAPAWVKVAPAAQGEANAKLLTAWVNTRLDEVAVQYGYDNILSAVSYAGDPHPVYAADGDAFKAWRSAVWSAATAAIAAAKGGTAPMPTRAAFVAVLPAYVAPAAGSQPLGT